MPSLDFNLNLPATPKGIPDELFSEFKRIYNAINQVAVFSSGSVITPISHSTGAADAGKVPKTDGTGRLDVSFLPAGAGSVLDVAVTVSDGIIGSVANPTTHPNISLGLGDITPDSVVAVGSVTGANLSGVNHGDQTITLTGPVTGTGTGSFGTTITPTIVAAGPVGDSTHVPQITFNAAGQLTAVTSVLISGGGGSSGPEIFAFAAAHG